MRNILASLLRERSEVKAGDSYIWIFDIFVKNGENEICNSVCLSDVDGSRSFE